MRPRELRRFISARRPNERADVGPVERDIVDRARRQRRVVLEGSALQPESSIPRGDLRARGTHDAERDSEDSERRAQYGRARIPNRGVHRSPPVRGQPQNDPIRAFPEDRAAVETDGGWSLRSASQAPQMAGEPAKNPATNPTRPAGTFPAVGPGTRRLLQSCPDP